VQASLLDATDVLVTGHGAVISMYVFLPRCSVVVDLSSGAGHRWMNVHAAKTLKPLQLQTVSVSRMASGITLCAGVCRHSRS
jgi:hypothetical protein